MPSGDTAKTADIKTAKGIGFKIEGIYLNTSSILLISSGASLQSKKLMARTAITRAWGMEGVRGTDQSRIESKTSNAPSKLGERKNTQPTQINK